MLVSLSLCVCAYFLWALFTFPKNLQRSKKYRCCRFNKNSWSTKKTHIFGVCHQLCGRGCYLKLQKKKLAFYLSNPFVSVKHFKLTRMTHKKTNFYSEKKCLCNFSNFEFWKLRSDGERWRRRRRNCDYRDCVRNRFACRCKFIVFDSICVELLILIWLYLYLDPIIYLFIHTFIIL